MTKRISLTRIFATAAILFLGAQAFIACKDNEDPTPAPTIAGFTPASAMEGAVVVITGENFSTVKSDNTVKFNGTAATVAQATATQITVAVPAGTTTGKITVEVDGQMASSATEFVFIPVPTAPVITGINPATAAEGTVVIITGTNFSTTGSANLVNFNGVEAAVTNATATTITTTVPAGATTGKVTVKVGTETGGSSVDFVVITPTITGFTPSTALAGAPIVITGTNFGPASIVKFNGATASITNLTATQITATVPANATTGKITVQVGTKTATSLTDFTLIVLPTVTTFTPATGAIGREIVLSGNRFDLTMTNNVVTFNGTPAVVTAATSTQLTTMVPYGATTGAVKVTVNGTALTYVNDFTVISSWTQKTSSFPGVQRNSEFSFGVSGKGYVGGGYGTSWLTDFYEFDPAGNAGAGSWLQKASLFAGGIYASTSFVAGPNGNTFGIIIDGNSDTFFYQGGSTNAWSYLNATAVDNGSAGYATVFVVNGQAYIKNVDGTVRLLTYDSSLGNLSDPYPEGTSSYQATFTIGNTAFVGGGSQSFSTNVPFNSFYSYTAAGGWTKLNDLPVSGSVTMFAVDGVGYLKKDTTMYRYNKINDSWTRLEDAPATMQYSQASFIIGLKAYIGLSLPGSTGATHVWEFDPSK